MPRSQNLLQVHSWLEDDARVAYQSAGLGCVLGQLEGNLDMALRSQIVDFLRVRLPAVQAQIRQGLVLCEKGLGVLLASGYSFGIARRLERSRSSQLRKCQVTWGWSTKSRSLWGPHNADGIVRYLGILQAQSRWINEKTWANNSW